jgi:hypothetical protein
MRTHVSCARIEPELEEWRMVECGGGARRGARIGEARVSQEAANFRTPPGVAGQRRTLQRSML